MIFCPKMADQQPNLPPGFRFHTTDEELVIHYLGRKLASLPLPASIIADIKIYKFDPWELPDKAVFREKEWYYFSSRDRKYPNGARPNRAAASGYWKATGTDKVIVNSKTRENIGIKKVLVFYKGKPPSGVKTRWIMHEFRLTGTRRFNHCNRARRLADALMRLDNWVLFRIYHKSNVTSAIPVVSLSSNFEEETCPKPLVQSINHCSFSNLLDSVDLPLLCSILQDDNIIDSAPAPTPPPSSQVDETNHCQMAYRPVPTFEIGIKWEWRQKLSPSPPTNPTFSVHVVPPYGFRVCECINVRI